MNLAHNIRIAAVTAIACVGMSTAVSTPAIAYSPIAKLSSGPVKPTVKMTWHECWRSSYFAARDQGSSSTTAEAEADLTCGRSPDEF